jgi:hypothetical protein
VSWYDIALAPGVASSASSYDSTRFGVTVDRVSVSAASTATLDEVVDAIRASTADVVILRYPADRVRWFATLTELDRTPILADNLVGWRLTTGKGRRPVPRRGIEVVGTATPEAMDGMVAETFRGYGNHYLANPLFAPDLVLAGYQEWARREVSHGVVALRSTQREGPPEMLGFLTYDDTKGCAEFALGGVVSRAQGGGLYAHLLAGMEDRAISRQAEYVVCSTQSRNVRVQRCWAAYGFVPVVSVFTVHLIRPGLLE